MDNKSRFLRTIKGETTDRPPLFVTFTPQVARKMSDYLGIRYEEPLDSLLSTRISHMELLTRLGNDAVGIAACAPLEKPTIKLEDGTIKNEWGMVFREKGLYNEFCEYPLSHAETENDIRKYDFFDPNMKGRFTDAERTVREYAGEYAVIGDLETTIFETAWYLTGLEKLLIDLLQGTAYVEPLFDRIMEINIRTGTRLIELGADMIWGGDDFGTQHGMIMDPGTWRKYFKPRMKHIFDEFRRKNPEIKIAWHTCGSIVPVIPDLIEIGLDVLNPIQPEAEGMDPVFLKKEFGKDLIFFGGVSVQNLLPYGNPFTIREEVKRLSDILGDDGGYIIAPAHNIQDDTPVENIIAFFEAVQKL